MYTTFHTGSTSAGLKGIGHFLTHGAVRYEEPLTLQNHSAASQSQTLSMEPTEHTPQKSLKEVSKLGNLKLIPMIKRQNLPGQEKGRTYPGSCLRPCVSLATMCGSLLRSPWLKLSERHVGKWSQRMELRSSLTTLKITRATEVKLSLSASQTLFFSTSIHWRNIMKAHSDGLHQHWTSYLRRQAQNDTSAMWGTL